MLAILKPKKHTIRNNMIFMTLQVSQVCIYYT